MFNDKTTPILYLNRIYNIQMKYTIPLLRTNPRLIVLDYLSFEYRSDSNNAGLNCLSSSSTFTLTLR